jgi:hypothetical protein
MIHLLGYVLTAHPPPDTSPRAAPPSSIQVIQLLVVLGKVPENFPAFKAEAVYKKAVVLMRNVAHDKALLAECMRLQVVVAPALPRCPPNPRLETNRVFVEWEDF